MRGSRTVMASSAIPAAVNRRAHCVQTCQTAAYGTQTHVAHVVDVGFMTRSVQKVNNTEFIPLGGIIYLVSLLGAIGGYVLNWF